MSAWERVGETADAQGRWLVRFSELESKRLSTGDRLNLQWEALLFTLGKPVNFRMPLPPHALLLRWQAWLRAGLAQLKAGGVWEAELGRRVIHAKYGSRGPQEEYRLLQGDGYWRDFRDAFRERALRTITSLGRRFRFCDPCGRPFVARRRQAYCAARCSQAVRTKRYRERDPARVRRLRREGYARKQRGLYGPKVRVGRREAPIGKSHAVPKKSAQAAPGFARQLARVRLPLELSPLSPSRRSGPNWGQQGQRGHLTS